MTARTCTVYEMLLLGLIDRLLTFLTIRPREKEITYVRDVIIFLRVFISHQVECCIFSEGGSAERHLSCTTWVRVWAHLDAISAISVLDWSKDVASTAQKLTKKENTFPSCLNTFHGVYRWALYTFLFLV